MNEKEADGGFFPVGPWGEHRLWHGGVHLAARRRAIRCSRRSRAASSRRAWARRRRSARSTSCCSATRCRSVRRSRSSSTRCTCTSPTSPKAGTPVEWMTRESKDKSGWKDKGKAGVVVLLDEPIEAGAVIGHVGTAGPAELAKAPDPRRDLLGVVPVREAGELAMGRDRRLGQRPVLRRRRSSTASTRTRTARSRKQELAQFYQGGGSAQIRYHGDAPRLGVDRRAELERGAARAEGLQGAEAGRDRRARRRADHAGPVVGRAPSRRTASCRPTASSITTTRSPSSLVQPAARRRVERRGEAEAARRRGCEGAAEGHHRRSAKAIGMRSVRRRTRRIRATSSSP